MRYMLVIKTESKEKALEIAKGISGFTLDESYGARMIKIGKYVVRGESAQKPEIPGVEAFPDGIKAQPTEPQPEQSSYEPSRYAPTEGGRLGIFGGEGRGWRSKGCP